MSALETLSTLPVETQKDALASATRTLLPQPPAAQRQQLLVPNEILQQLMAEVRRKLRIDPKNNSPEADARILEYVSKTLSSLLQDTDPATIKARLGERGDLSPRDYKIMYPGDFFNFQRGLAIRRSHVEEVLSSPSNVQHMSSGKADISIEVFPNLSFYSKVHVDKEGSLFSLVVQSIRRADVQHIYSAWRIYHDDVVMPTPYSPLALFEAFVSKYGDDLQIRDKVFGKFLLYQILPDVSKDELDAMSSPNKDEPLKTTQLNSYTDSATNISYVAFGYTINILSYCHDLALHGVRVHPERIRLGSFLKYTR